MPYYGKGIVKATGLENPAKAEHVDVGIAHSTSMPGVQMPGTKTRKIVDPVWQGQLVAGEQDKVSVRGGSKQVGKQTWPGAREGFTKVAMPKRAEPAPASCTYQDDPKYGKNEEKGPGKQTLTEKANVGNENIRKGGGSPMQGVKDRTPGWKRRIGEAKQVAGIS